MNPARKADGYNLIFAWNIYIWRAQEKNSFADNWHFIFLTHITIKRLKKRIHARSVSVHLCAHIPYVGFNFVMVLVNSGAFFMLTKQKINKIIRLSSDRFIARMCTTEVNLSSCRIIFKSVFFCRVLLVDAMLAIKWNRVIQMHQYKPVLMLYHSAWYFLTYVVYFYTIKKIFPSWTKTNQYKSSNKSTDHRALISPILDGTFIDGFIENHPIIPSLMAQQMSTNHERWYTYTCIYSTHVPSGLMLLLLLLCVYAGCGYNS